MSDDPRLESYRSKLVRAVAHNCPPWLADQREDIVQNAMLRVMAVLKRGEENEIRTASYLWKVAYSATISEIRRQRRWREEPLDGDAAKSARSNPGPEQETRRVEIGQGIRRCLRRVIGPRRHAVLLHLYGYGLEESARILGCVVKRVDNLRYRGLADLRRCLEKKGIVP